MTSRQGLGVGGGTVR